LAGLSNEYNIWASDLEQGNVETMQSLIDIDENLNLLSGHVFQFDFLNDSFDKLPGELKKIIDDPEKRKKLIVYINPPYAEGDNRKGEGRRGVAVSKIQEKYSLSLGYTKREIFAQFLARIYFEIPDCKIAEFSTLKTISAPRSKDFRNFFKAKLEKCFIVKANTFDNVIGNFPIGFKIWDTSKKESILISKVDIFNEDNEYLGKKNYYTYDSATFINDWAKTFRNLGSESIATLIGIGNNFQKQDCVYIDQPNIKVAADNHHWQITPENLIQSAIYFAVRHCISHTWINHDDQILYPSDDGYKTDFEFQNDCIVFTLFHSKNCFSAQYGTNHWIPFTEKQVGAREKFESNFMSEFLKERAFSFEAHSVLDAGLALWKYYHSKIKSNKTASVNASYYDIRAFFQGHGDKGRMRNKSDDKTYDALIGSLRDAQKALAIKIQPKVYRYGFLKE
jgi:hypothetical protein